jgi:nucleotide-binding universal stress UspA family protein
MKTILVAIDFTPGTPDVICTAARLAVATHSRLQIMHITDARHIGHDYEKIEDVLEHSDPKTNLSAAEGSRLAVTGDSLCVVGDPARRILEEAKAVRADLIVLGSKNHGRLLEVVHPSTVHRVLAEAVCPVVVVPLIRSQGFAKFWHRPKTSRRPHEVHSVSGP